MNTCSVPDTENTKMSKRIILEKIFWAVQSWDNPPALNGDLT